MNEKAELYCPECQDPQSVDRREFLETAAIGTTAIVGLSAFPSISTSLAEETVKKTKPAEALVKELCATLSVDQKKEVILPFNHGMKNGKGRPTRWGMYNSALLGKRIGKIYNKSQQEIIEKILKSISSGEEGYEQISRRGKFDRSGSLQNCGAVLFGDPSDDKEYCWVFTGHHLTIRCDGNSSDGLAFGGPLYYGHSPNGYTDRNVFYYQTECVMDMFDALSDKQRKQALVPMGTPGERERSVHFRGKKNSLPGIGYDELTKAQQELVEKVMKTLMSPYRKEDTEEVMQILKATGGLQKLHLAFYPGRRGGKEKQPWHFWRVEGPGFVWNFRVLPHVHTYVSIAKRAYLPGNTT